MSFLIRLFSPSSPAALPAVAPLPLAPHVDPAPTEQPIPVATVIEPIVETEEEKTAKQQQAINALMDKFYVPVKFIEALEETTNRGELTKEIVRNAVSNSKGWNIHEESEINSETEGYFSQLTQLRQLMLYFKDRDLNLDNLGAAELMALLATKTWEETPKHQQCVDALKQRIIHASEERVSNGFRFPNIILNKLNFHLFFKNVNYSEFSEEEKKAVFKTMDVLLLIDPNFMNSLVKDHNDRRQVALERAANAVEQLVDRFDRVGRKFVWQLGFAPRYEEDRWNVVRLAIFCAQVKDLNPALAKKVKKSLGKEEYRTYPPRLFENQLSLAEAAIEVERRLNISTEYHLEYDLYRIRYDMINPENHKELTSILAENPHLLKALRWNDLLKILQHFSTEDIRSAMLAQIAIQKDLSSVVLFHGKITPEQKTMLESKISTTDYEIWSHLPQSSR